jgi:hypothetical protein
MTDRKQERRPATRGRATRNRVGYLPLMRRVGIYIVSGGIWLSGCVWVIFHYFLKAEDEFGFQNQSPWEHVSVVIHAAFSFFGIWVFGMLWLTHIKTGWITRTNRLTGGTLFSVVTWLILSGYGLYYIGNSNLRGWISYAHWIVGLAALAAFFIHIFPYLSKRFDNGARD